MKVKSHGVDFDEEIGKIAGVIRVRYKPEKIILFGSAARRTMNEESDIDMLIIKRTRKKRFDRIREVLSLVDYSIPFEPIVLTPGEISRRKEMGDYFIKKVLKEGRVLYG